MDDIYALPSIVIVVLVITFFNLAYKGWGQENKGARIGAIVALCCLLVIGGGIWALYEYATGTNWSF